MKNWEALDRELAEEYGDKYARGDVPTEGIDAEGYFADNKPQDSEGISEFPTLIYDGPFSESSEKLEPRVCQAER
mgnify:CR=1 FL=1